MKRLLLVAFAVVLTSSLMFGQIAYKMGENNASGFVGLGGLAGLYGTSTLPAIGGSYEVGYNENISIGGLAGISGSEQDLGFFGKFKYTYIIIGGRGLYHYDLMHNEKIDTYGGVMLGYNIVSSSYDGNYGSLYTASGSYLAYGGFIGGRYYFSPNLSAQAELGYGLGLLSVGLSYKM